jgi:large subunit ribosomal protein L17
MVTSLFKHGQVETTDAKAKQLKPVAEKMITLAKRGDLHARRQALSFIREKAVTHRLFDEIKDRYTNRPGGYIRIVKKGLRKGDAAPVSVVQLLPAEEGAKKKGLKKTKAPAEPTTKKRASEEAKPKAEEETAPQESAPSQEPVEETNPEKAEAESDDPS